MAKKVLSSEIKNALGEVRRAKIAEARRYAEQLGKLGYAAIFDAYQKREYENQSYNLHDSYGCAVYVKGELIKSSIHFAGSEQSRKDDKNTGMDGRETLMHYFDTHKFGTGKHEIVLICVAAMYYAGILESGQYGGGGNRKKIQVISGARDYIDRNWKRYFPNDKTKGFSIVKRESFNLSELQ